MRHKSQIFDDETRDAFSFIRENPQVRLDQSHTILLPTGQETMTTPSRSGSATPPPSRDHDETSYVRIMSGGLKIKGGLKKSKKKKKKKKKKKRKRDDRDDRDADLDTRKQSRESGDNETGNDGHIDTIGGRTVDGIYEVREDTRTEAEKRFEERYRERLLNLEDKKMEKLVTTSHRERVEAFNKYLTELSEHHDVPKVGNAGLG